MREQPDLFPPGWGLPPMPVADAATVIAAGLAGWGERRKRKTSARPRIRPEVVESIKRLAAMKRDNVAIARALNVNYRSVWRYAKEVRP